MLSSRGFSCESSFEVLCLSLCHAFADNNITCHGCNLTATLLTTCDSVTFRFLDVNKDSLSSFKLSISLTRRALCAESYCLFSKTLLPIMYFVAVRYSLIGAGDKFSNVQSAAWPGQLPHMAGVWTIRWVTQLLCLCFTCCQVDLKHRFPLGFGIFFFFPTGVGFRFLLEVSASNKLFYRRFPVRLFCSYIVKTLQKWLPRRSWK